MGSSVVNATGVSATDLSSGSTFTNATLVSPTSSNPTFTGNQIGNAYPIAQSGAAVSGAADTNENILGTITIPANALGANGILRYWAQFTVNNNANAKTVRARFNGIGGTIFYSASMASAVSNYTGMFYIANRNATNSQVGLASNGLTLANGNAVITSAVDTTVATTLVLTVQKGVAGDTMTLEAYGAEIIRLS